MGAPLILTKNRNNSPENPTNVPIPVEEMKLKPEAPEHEEETAVNGKLDINIKDNSINEQSESNTPSRYQQFTDFRHNYH